MHRPVALQPAVQMPEISRFLGIVIQMYYREHGPPHFHAAYGRAEASICIDPPGLLSGALPPRVLAIVVEWGSLHQEELRENWSRLRDHKDPFPIAPLA